MTVAEKILTFYQSLSIDEPLPDHVEVMNPYQEKETFEVCSKFYRKYYNDHGNRILILGINPGRFGGGITGVPFTDPIKLETYCNIPNSLQKKPELSADFIYQMINAYGGVETFYKHFYISAISPLGFTKEGKNINYYDSKELHKYLESFILSSLNKQLAFGISSKTCYCLGEGANFKVLQKLNEQHHFFETIVPLAHPRFIMQYRRKKVDEYITVYLDKLNAAGVDFTHL